MRPLRRLAGLMTLVALSGCATIIHGSHREIPIVSEPSGAKVTLDSTLVGTTPVIASFTRGDEHTVVLSLDTARIVAHTSRSLSPWLAGNLFFYAVPALIDFGSGAAFDLSPDTIRAVFPGLSLAGAQRSRLWNLPRGVLVRGERGGALLTGTLDSATDKGLFLSSTGAEPIVLDATTDVRIGIDRGINAARYAGNATHYATLWASPLLLVPYLGIVVPVVIEPAAFVVGLAGAPRSWSPLAAYRVGSPLLLDDEVRVDALHGEVRGRLHDLSASALFVRRDDRIDEITRPEVRGLRRANGRDFVKGAAYGGIGGSVFGMIVCLALCSDQNRVESMSLTMVAGATVGLSIFPAFAPKRWVEVTVW